MRDLGGSVSCKCGESVCMCVCVKREWGGSERVYEGLERREGG